MGLSLDLRERVVAAVDDGMSRRGAAERFGVSAASAIRWTKRAGETGSAAAMSPGGDHRSGRIESRAAFILAAVETAPDITLVELRDKLLGECGESFGVTTIWRFFKRRNYTLKKSRRMRRSRTVPTS